MIFSEDGIWKGKRCNKASQRFVFLKRVESEYRLLAKIPYYAVMLMCENKSSVGDYGSQDLFICYRFNSSSIGLMRPYLCIKLLKIGQNTAVVRPTK